MDPAKVAAATTAIHQTANDKDKAVVLWAAFALTLQLVRLSIDIIQSASRQEDKEIDSADAAAAAAAAASVAEATFKTAAIATATPNQVVPDEAAAFLQPTNGGREGNLYGSMQNDEEQQQQQQSLLATTGTTNTHNQQQQQQHPSFFLEVYPKIFVLIHIGLMVYFTIQYFALALVLPFDPSLFSPRFFLLCNVVLLMNVWFLLGRDVHKTHLGLTQRVFSFLAATTLWLATLVQGWTWYTHHHHHHHHNQDDASSLSSSTSSTLKQMVLLYWVDCGTMVAVTIYLVSDWIHVRYTPYPILPKTIQKKKTKPTLSRHAIFTLLQPYFWPNATDTTATWNRIRAILTWVCVILSKLSNVISPILLGNSSTALAHGQYAKCIQYAIAYCSVTFCGAALKEGQTLIYMKVAQAAFVQLSETTFWHLHNLSLDWHLKKKLGEVIRSMDRGIGACDTLMRYLFLWLVPAMLECFVVCIIFAFYFSYWPLAMSVFYFVFAYVVWTILVTVWRKKFRKAVVMSDNEWHDLFTDSLINFETVKMFTAETYEMRRFGDAVRNYQAGSVNVQASLSFLNVTQTLILQACLATALSLTAVGIQQRINCCLASGCESGISDCCQNLDVCQGMQVGDFVAVLSYTLQLFAPLNFLGSVYNAIVMAVIDLTSLSELLAESPEVTDSPSAVPLPKTNVYNPDIAVEFENVYFHYPTQPQTKGLKGLSFKMKRGTTTAIVGPTGSGKTTVSRLLFRFYDVLGGAVKVNGIDIRQIKQASLRGAIGVVPQNASMFNDTIRANLLYGRRDATQAELEQAARDSQVLDFIESLDDGWETMVGDRGLKLSGGEKQRAAIARCLLKDPPFVLLDEATSALDTITEASVQEALDRLGNERTVLVIAHRLGTIRNADNIIVLKDGLVNEQGTHDELMARNGTYAEMWNMQLHSSASSSMIGLNVTQE